MTVKQPEYVCIEKQQLAEHKADITALKARADYKELRIEELNDKIEKIDTKLDNISESMNQLILKSVTDDNELNQRVTSLENTVKVLKWVVSLVFGSGVLWIILNFAR